MRKYVEAMKDASQLLDLLASVDENEIEPTRAAGGRQYLYDEVNIWLRHIRFAFLTFAKVSPFCYAHQRRESRGVAPRPLQRQPI